MEKKLQVAGIRMVNVDADGLVKAEGVVTCCSLVFTARIDIIGKNILEN